MSLLVHAERVARRKLAPLPQGWKVCSWRRIGRDCVQLCGGVAEKIDPLPDRTGRIWHGELQTVEVTLAEVQAEIARYESETGRCGECLGDGHAPILTRRQLVSRHPTPCQRCAGTRRAPAPRREIRETA